MIDNKQAIKFSNENLRPIADKISQLYSVGKAIKDTWEAQELQNIILNDVNEIVQDGAESDGRPIINGKDLNGVIAILIRLVAFMEENESEKLKAILKIAPNPTMK